MSPRYSIVIPAYNEERTIAHAILETESSFDTLGEPYEMIVVDDGSRDLTAGITQRMQAHRPRLHLVQHAINQGKGKAVQSGVLQSQGEFILFLDADLSTHPSMIERVRPSLKNNKIFIGSRTIQGSVLPSPQPWLRRIAGTGFNLFLVRLYLGLPYRDTQCGFKIFPASAKSLFEPLKTTGWAFDVELLLRAQKAGYVIQEMPVIWNHHPQSRVRLGDWYAIWQEIRRLKRS